MSALEVDPVARRTAKAMVGVGLSAVPLAELFTDRGWLIDIWLGILITMVPALVLRRNGRARLVDLAPGVLLALLWLTARYLPDHAIAHVIPTWATLHDLSALTTSLRTTMSDEVAPLHTTPPVRMALVSAFVLLAVATDALAVIAERPAIAAIPLLLIYTLAGAVPRHPVGWLLFIPAATGFLLLLSCNSGAELPRWGRVMPRSGTTPARSLALSGRRIGVIAVVIAVALPLLVPARSTNLISNALHNGSTGSGSGNGKGSRLNPFVSLRGNLQRGKVVNLYSVKVNTLVAKAPPFYLRDKVLEVYAKNGFQAGPTGTTEDLAQTDFSMRPAPDGVSDRSIFDAAVQVTGGRDNPPIFGTPGEVDGLDSRWSWDPGTGLVNGPGVKEGDTFTESVYQPDPTAAQLAAVHPPADPSTLSVWTQLPTLPQAVQDLAQQLKANTTSNYQIALAILAYLSPSNGFVYSLQTKNGDSGSDLVDFLNNRAGFCQQYAATMTVLLRAAGVPARVVLGYTHAPADSSGSFTVTTHDAHAWVEAFFAGVGWVPFDPTPLSTVDPGRAVALPYAVPSSSVTGPAQKSSEPVRPNPSAVSTVPLSGSTTPTAQAATTTSGPSWMAVAVVAIVVLAMIALLTPALIRRRTRRRRLRAGSVDPLWTELSATAHDLGYVWSAARSPRQVVGWLSTEAALPGPARGALATLATAVERERYTAGVTQTSDEATHLVGQLRSVESGLRQHRGSRVRWLARLRPASLGWTLGPRSLRHGRH